MLEVEFIVTKMQIYLTNHCRLIAIRKSEQNILCCVASLSYIQGPSWL